MSVSVDKDSAEGGESSRRVLASWLDDYSAGRCDRADMQESFLSVCRSNSDAPWDALALLDQYQRRGRIDAALARTLKADIAQLVFGNANQTEAPRDATREHGAEEEPADTTGTRWRKLLEERGDQTEDVEPVFADPTLFRRDVDPATRPPPPLKLREEAPAPAARAASSAPPSDVLRDRYELLTILGRGSSGTVYKALDRHRTHLPLTSRYVAVKVLKLDYRSRPEALAELEREFHQAQSLSHPNIVSVFDLDRDGDTYFIVMELLEGLLLADVVARLDGSPMRREHALAIISSIGAALAHAHRRDIVHADLKPRNVMITNTGEVRVLDFGFARHRALELHSASAFDAVPATAPAYASVERVNGSEPHPSDDVYSLACIAYQLLSGEHPFGGRSAVLARAHGRAPKAIPGLTRKQMQSLNRALLWSRGERKIDVVDLLAALGCAAAPNKLVSPQMLAMPDELSGWRRWRGAALLAFALIVAGIVGAFLFLERESPAPTAAQPAPARAETDATASKPEASEPVEAATTPAPAAKKSDKQNTPAAAPARKQTAVAAAPKADSSAGAQSGGQVAIEFDKDTYVATESDGSVRIVVHRRGPTQRPVSFRWRLRSNSAEQGSDFANIGPGVETIPAGSSTATITVPLVSDSIVENTEVFLVEIEPDQPGVVLGERSHAAVIIVDDD